MFKWNWFSLIQLHSPWPVDYSGQPCISCILLHSQSRVPISSSDQGAACCCLTSVHRSWSYPQQSQCKIRTMSRWFKITSTSILLRIHNIGLHQTRVRFLSSGMNTITTSRPSRTESITTRNNTTIHWWWDEATKIDTWYYSRCLKFRCFNRFQSWFINISYLLDITI